MDPVRESGNASIGRDAAPRWTFVTNHFLVLASVAGDPDLRVRDIASLVGNKVRRGSGFRHPILVGTSVGEVLDVVLSHYEQSAVG